MKTLELTQDVIAYIGPGSGFGAIGALIALIVALLVTGIAFVYYPLKRLRKTRELQRRRPSQDKEE